MRKDALVTLSRPLGGLLILLIVLSAASPVGAQEKTDVSVNGVAPTVPTAPTPTPTVTSAAPATSSPLLPQISVPDLNNRQTFPAAMRLVILLTVLSLAPAILIMMTSFTRIVIVLSLLRQALGTQQLPPNQILIGLALFMRFLLMGPTWKEVNEKALQAYMDGKIDQKTALTLADGSV